MSELFTMGKAHNITYVVSITAAGSLENTLKVNEIIYLNGFTNAKSIYIVQTEATGQTNIIFYKLALYCSMWLVVTSVSGQNKCGPFLWSSVNSEVSATLLTQKVALINV